MSDVKKGSYANVYEKVKEIRNNPNKEWSGLDLNSANALNKLSDEELDLRIAEENKYLESLNSK